MVCDQQLPILTLVVVALQKDDDAWRMMMEITIVRSIHSGRDIVRKSS